jgi:purine-nucleoside phosphorylase
MGSGMGIPSITLYATELFSFFGVEAIIRIGSAGAIADDVKVRDVLLAMTATTNSAYSDCLAMPGHVAPCATWEMLRNAADIADEMGIKSIAGNAYKNDGKTTCFWTYTINGEEPSSGRAGNTPINEGDTIIYVYQQESNEDLAEAGSKAE